MDLRNGIFSTAQYLGIDPYDLATAISYETAGTFDPTKRGPTTQWGQHRGLIQFGEPQAQKYGVDWNDPLGSQLGPGKAVARYLQDTGVKPGMGMLDIYSAINAGGVGRYNRSDANNGGAPGTVRDKVEKQMAGHRRKAQALLGGDFTPKQPSQPTGLMAEMGQQPAIGGAGNDNLGAQDMQDSGGLLGMLFPNMGQETRERVRYTLAGLGAATPVGANTRVMDRIDDRRDKREARSESDQQRNRTAQWLAQQPGGQQYAAAIASGALPASQALQMYRQDSQGATPTDDMREYQYAAQNGFKGSFQQWMDRNQQGGKATPYTDIAKARSDLDSGLITQEQFNQIAGGAKTDVEGESKLRKEYTGRADVKSFKEQADAFARLRASADNPDAAGDLAIVFNYMKMLDPGSTVREGEAASVQNAAGVPERVRNVWNQLATGERLSPAQRNEFVGRAGQIYEAARMQYQGTQDQFRNTAGAYGFDADRSVPDMSYQSPFAPQNAPRPGQRPAPPSAPAPAAWTGPSVQDVQQMDVMQLRSVLTAYPDKSAIPTDVLQIIVERLRNGR